MMIYSGELQLLASPDVTTALGNFLHALSSTSIIKSRDLASEMQQMPAIRDLMKKGEKVEIMDLQWSVADLALACRQDSGSEFHLSDQEVTKYKAGVTSLSDAWEKA